MYFFSPPREKHRNGEGEDQGGRERRGGRMFSASVLRQDRKDWDAVSRLLERFHQLHTITPNAKQTMTRIVEWPQLWLSRSKRYNPPRNNLSRTAGCDYVQRESGQQGRDEEESKNTRVAEDLSSR